MSAAAEGLRVGFVGLGNMGWPMARNLVAAGFALTVRDADPGREAAFAAASPCMVATSPQSFSDVAAVVTMLPDDRIVREAILGWGGGIGRALRRGAVVADMSSANPRGTKALGAELVALGVGLVDAPVSGGVARAETGTLSIMIGADDEAAVDVALPLFEVLGERLFRTGPLGSGHAMKALNNFAAAAAYTASVEALTIGRQFGLDPRTMVDVINSSTGRSFASELVLAQHVVTGRYATEFALGLLAKDVGIAADLAGASGIDAPVCEVVGRRWAEAVAALGARADHSEAHKSWWDAPLASDLEGTAPGRPR